MKIGNIKDVLTIPFFLECFNHAKVYNSRGRTFEQILEQTIQGEAVETLVCKWLNIKPVPFSIPEYDGIDNDGTKYEIKHTIYNDKWWNFIPSKYGFFLKNAKDLDYIVLCYVNQDTYNVYLKFKACAKTFEDYSTLSKFNKGWYYNVDIAERNNHCVKY